MGRIEWHDKLSLGIDAIDDQHQAIVNIANVLLAALEKEKDKTVVKALLGDLRKTIFHHIAFEERYMKKTGYPDADMHAAEHQKIRGMLSDLQHRLFDRVGVEPEEIRAMLREYMLGHFLKIDGQLAVYLKENNRLQDVLVQEMKETATSDASPKQQEDTDAEGPSEGEVSDK